MMCLNILFIEINALIFSLPGGFSSRCLNDSDALKANDEWLFNHPGSLFYLRRLARLNPSCGVFTHDGNELVSSVFQLVFFVK